MLREKESFMEELLAAWRTCLQRQYEQRRLAMRVFQEDLLHRVKVAGELIALGEYQPLADGILATKAASNVEDEVDDFGRRKPVATVNGNPYYSHADAFTARQKHIATALEAHIVLATLDEDQQHALRRQRWEYLSSASSQNTLSLYFDALLHCLEPVEWVQTWQREVEQVSMAMTTMMEDVAYEVMSISEMLKYAIHIRSRVPGTFLVC